jgi:hypothetical protein
MRARSHRTILICCFLFVLFSAGFLSAEKISVKVISQDAFVRLTGSINSMIISQVPLGTVLEASEKVGEWYKVALPPDEQGFVVQGYIHSTEVEVIAVEEPELPRVSPTVQKIRLQQPAAKDVEQMSNPSRKSKIQFGLKFMGGGDYFLIGDLNDYLQGQQDYLSDDTSIMDIQGSYKPLKYGYSGGAEFFIDFTRFIGIGIGAGYFQVNKKNEVNRTHDYSSVDDPNPLYKNEMIFPQIKAIPLTFSLNFGLPLGSVVKIKLSGGVGYYLGTIIWDYQMEANFLENKMFWESKSNTLGYHGSLGIEVNLGRRFGFFIEGFGRYAKLKDMSGSLTINEIWMGDEINSVYESSFLKFLEINSYITDKWYPLVSIDEDGVV